MHRLLPLVALSLASAAAHAQDLLTCDFTGTEPSMNRPWAATSFLDPNLQFSGWDLGPGAFAIPGVDDVFAYDIDAGFQLSDLPTAIGDGEYLHCTLTPTVGTFDLSGKRVDFTMQRTNWSSPQRFALFTSIDGFAAGQELYVSPLVDAANFSAFPFSFLFPPSGYDGISGPVEFRIVPFHANFDHDVHMTAFSIVQGGPAYTIDVSVAGGGGGTASVTPVASYYEAGTTVQFDAVPDTGWSFQGWGGDLQGRGTPRTLAIQQDMVVTASFQVPQPPSMELGMNLAGVSDWSTQWDFVDVMRTARPWYSQDLGGTTWDSGFGWEVPKDADGWPLQVPFTASDGQLHKVFTVLQQPEGGTYTLFATGSGTIEVLSGTTWHSFSFTGGSTSVPVTLPALPPLEILTLTLASSDVADPLRDIRFVRPGFAATHQAEPFHPLFLERLAPFTNLRFMDWGATNSSWLQQWSDRTTATTYTQRNGVALELMAQLANTLDQDPWVCIPHRADDLFIRETARLLRDQVDPGLRIHVEYSNETWNPLFSQTTYVQDMGEALGLSTDRWEAGQRYAGLRSQQVWEIFEQEFVDDSRIVKVLATHVSNVNTTHMRISQLLDANTNPGYLMPDMLAIAPYFGINYDGSTIPSLDTILDADCVASIDVARSEVQLQRAIAEAQGMTLGCYEGGQHILPIGPGFDDTVLLDRLIEANRDPRMGQRYLEYLDMLQVEGVGLYSNFSYVGTPSRYGMWGVLEYQDQPIAAAPKYQALLDWTVPVLSFAAPPPGQAADLQLIRGTPAGTVFWGLSTTGPGPTPTPFGDLLLTGPIRRLPDATVANDGTALTTLQVPAGSSGLQVWFHALDLATGTFSNGVGVTIP